MARLFLFLLLVTGVVAIATVLVSIWRKAFDTPVPVAGSGGRQGNRIVMTPTGFQKIAYAALIVLMFGVTTGWLGGL
mgnify:CR=1 FL=1|jgi:hypothetical protein